MQFVNEQARRKMIFEFCENNFGMETKKIISHFCAMGMAKSTIYDVVQRFRMKESPNRKPQQSKKCSLQLAAERRRLKKMTVGKVSKSLRCLGKKFKCAPTTVRNYLKKMNIIRRKRTTAPKVTEQQIKTQKERLRNLVKELFFFRSSVKCVMDDESYFTIDGSEWQPKDFFMSPNLSPNEKVKYIRKT